MIDLLAFEFLTPVTEVVKYKEEKVLLKREKYARWKYSS
jgi:hypothetical protein